MDYLKNFCWSHSSHWDGKVYHSMIIVTLRGYDEYKEDWDNLIDTVTYDTYYTYPKLKPHILEWLTDNIPDTKDGGKGWCVDSVESVKRDAAFTLHIHFQLRRDAMKFIKKFSVWKKPLDYIQYFTDVRKRLDTKTMRYISR